MIYKNLITKTKTLLLGAVLGTAILAVTIAGCTGETGLVHGRDTDSAANWLAPDETFDMIRSGGRLIMNYDAQSNSFKGTVENTTNNVLTRVRIKVLLGAPYKRVRSTSS